MENRVADCWLWRQAKDGMWVLYLFFDTANKATLQFNLAGLTALFRSHYSASFVEREQLKPRTKGAQNFRITQREIYDADTDRSTPTDIYIYQDIVPQGYLVQK
ncbi:MULTISPECIES: hypothetical protein [unclassified Chamaesiphon]|uniref:hypothetical protein n=1 Tax=unclassified Chamaesiphon TaxID=2620921 RepID=UPI00286B9871|nr:MULTISPECIES: hypothetical protein [unclassified Chamaesiphon]